jgi:hypothetical protein
MSDLHVLRKGASVGGAYTLECRVRQDHAGTFYSVVTDTGERLLMKLIPAQSTGAGHQFATWQRSRHLRHENLLHLHDVGRAVLDGTDYIYAVFEYPEEMLSSALQNGPLSESEARGVLEAALAALRYLHGQGMVYGALDGDHVAAVGDTVKLATDGLAESSDLQGPLEDVRQLGELVRAIRSPESLDEPFAIFVKHATVSAPRQRWTLAELAKVIEPAPAALPAPASPRELAAVSPVILAAEPPAVSPAPPEPPAIATPASALRLPAPRVRATPEPSSHGSPKWILAAMAILLISIVAFALRRKSEGPPVMAATPGVNSPAPNPVAPLAPNTPPPPANLTATSSGNWHVIAFTYYSSALAENRVHQINERWPDLHAALFKPKASHGYYLVGLGRGMSREEAIRLQRAARGRGLPRDTYVQNYDE